MPWTSRLSYSNKKWDNLLDIISDGYWEWDPKKGYSDFFSDRFYEMIGYTPEELIDPEIWKDIIVDDPNEVNKAFHDHIKDPSTPFNCQITYRHKNGNLVYVISKGQLLFDDDGEPLKMIGTNVDITHLKNLEKELIEEKDKAVAHANASKVFLANMSHDIRTPMNGIVSLVELLMENPELQPKCLEYCGYIRKSANTLLKLLADILEYSKLESLDLSLKNKKCKIRELNIIDIWSTKFIKKNISLKIHISKTVPENIVLDKDRYLQLLNNLISNAYKYTEKGEVKITLYVKNDMFITKVKDTGCGIPKDKNDLIFIPFQRATDKEEGTGLGLSICKSLIQKIGGDIWFTSKEGKGSKFYLSYPLDNDYTESSGDYSPPKRAKIKLPERLHILIAEDNSINQIVIKEILSKYNVTFDIVETAKDAIKYYKQNKYDLIFMDIILKDDMNGDEAAKIIKKINPDAYIIAMTANAISGDKEKYLKVMDDYISKPITLNSIENLFKKYNKSK